MIHYLNKSIAIATDSKQANVPYDKQLIKTKTSINMFNV